MANLNPNVNQTSLPQTIPPSSLSFVRQTAAGDFIVDQTWYLFLYNVARHVLPIGGPPLITPGLQGPAGPALYLEAPEADEPQVMLMGGAVTVADGADIAQGAQADAVWVGGSGSEVSLLKALVPQYTTEFDYDGSGNVIYYGIAGTGTPQATASWQIRKLAYSGTNNLLSMLYANGSRSFANAWTNRVALSYS